MTKDFEIQMTFRITFNDEGFQVEINLSEPEYIATKGKVASKAYITSIGKKVWDKQIQRVQKVFDRKHQSYLSLISSLNLNNQFLESKIDKGFVVVFNSEADNEKIGESIDTFYKYILENCTVTLH